MELTPRLKRIKDRLFDEEFRTVKPWHFKGESILTDEEIIKEPLVIRKAKAYEYVAKKLPSYIKRDELIVGNPNYNSVGFGTILPNYATKEELEAAKNYVLDEISIWGHHPPDWNKVITKGVSGVKDEINEAIEKELLKPEPNSETLNEYRAMIICLNAIVIFAQRHAEAALKESFREMDPIRKRELYEIYRVCSKVPEHPAKTYQEALQSYWTTYCIINSGGNYVPLARGDQYLYPYFKKDLEEHRITKEYAIDLTGSFLAKFNERIVLDTKKVENHVTPGMFSHGVARRCHKKDDVLTGALEAGGFDARALSWREDESIDCEANFSYGQTGNSWLMNLIVGGLKPDGTDATNELSYLIVDLVHDMELLMPVLSARIHGSAPDSFIEKLAEVLRYGQGEPAIYNDDAIIPGFLDMGINAEDARNYSNDGCWETLIPGQSYFSYAHIQNLQCLEWVLTGGKSILREYRQEGLDTGDPCEFKDWDEFYEAYKKQMNDRIDFQVQWRLENFGMTNMIAPDPLMSSLMDDCIERGKDITQDGVRYYFHLILLSGLANTVDSLAVVKKLVFEEKSLKMEELVQAVRDNWKGHERLRARVLNYVPKYGNDDDYVDSIAVKLIKDFEERVQYWRRKQSRLLLPCGIGTFESYTYLGRSIGASPDGRLAKDALAANYSPFFGCDVEGPTAVFKSATKADLLRYYCGCPVDITINSNEFNGEAGIQRLKGLIRTFFSLGGLILTITSCNVEDLKDAKVNPEKHKNLRVRLGGFSSYFISLAPLQQDNIIRRFSKGARG